ncbi:MAG: dihydropteroate synthase, partial [Synergistaceae bacterium]|nr:dihydropteroate synthase [Synergistaceae bacterium]
FEERLSLAEKAGIPAERIILDPGLGFGKRCEDNLRILRNLDAFRIFGRPLLIGHSRKGFIGTTLGLADPEDRLEGTLAVTALCGLRNVALVRVHDVEANGRVLSMLGAVRECRG